jgi:hypothetical protein
MTKGIIYLEDKLGVTSGYERIWSMLVASARLTGIPIWRYSIYRHYPQFQWLKPFANRKAPTWNPETLPSMRIAVSNFIESRQPSLVICADPASIGLLGLNAEWATLDKLRGGVYHPKIGIDIPWVVTLPISAWHSKIKEKDLAAVNRGFTDKESYIEAYSTITLENDDPSPDIESIDSDSDSVHPVENLSDSDDSLATVDEEVVSNLAPEELYYEPIVVPYGRFVLVADMKKAGRLLRHGRISQESTSGSETT